MPAAKQPTLPTDPDAAHIMTCDRIAGKFVLACSCGRFGDDGRVMFYSRPAVQALIDHAVAMGARRLVVAATR